MKRAAFFLLFSWCASLPVLPCTTFILQGGDRIYFGRNLDWDWESGMVFVNLRKVQKRAFVLAGDAWWFGLETAITRCPDRCG